jgi:hypothetical protein
MRLVRYDTGKPFGAEWRCIDTAACDRRAKENE